MLNQKIRKALSLALATTMSFTMLFTGVGSNASVVEAASNYDSSSQLNFSTILGSGVDYGIIAENFQQRSHMQSTYAIESFSTTCSGTTSDINLNPVGTTSHLLIGGFVPGETELFGRTTNGPKYAFACGYENSSLVVEAPESVFAQEEGKDVNFMHQNFADEEIIVNPNAGTKVQNLYNKAFDFSSTLSTKATSEEYGVDYNDYFSTSGGGEGGDRPCLDLTKGNFANKVVYIDVDNNLLSYLDTADEFSIKKDSSTVIVFNIEDVSTNSTIKSENGQAYGRHGLLEEDFVKISTFQVSVDDGASWIRTTQSTGQDGKESVNDQQHYADTQKMDQEINQKIIWNIRTDKEVALDAAGGLFIVPNAFVDVVGSSTGWIVGRNIVNSAGEWHYTYGGNVFDNGQSGADVLISKQAVGGGDELPGATFTLTGKVSEDENAEDILFSEENSSEYTPVVVSNDQKSLNWETGKAPTEIKNLPDGVYTLKETAAPNGYDIASAVTFTIKDGVVTGSKNSVIPADDDNPAIVRVFDDLYKTDVTLSKRDINKSGELEGAKLAIAYDDEAKSIVNDAKTGERLEWISTDTPKKVSLLNGTYFMVELAAPGGYDDAASIEFEVKNGDVRRDGNAVDKVTMYDALIQAPKTDVYISKKAVSGDELAGATLVLTGEINDAGVVQPVVFTEDNVRRMMHGYVSDDKLSIYWTTDGSEARISDLGDGYYTLSEKAAPEGFEVTSDLYFEIKDGKLVESSVKKEVRGSTPAESGKGEAPEGTYTTGENNAPVITMFDDAKAPEPAKTDVLISKQAVGGGDELPGATFTLVGKDSDDKDIIFDSDNVLGTGASLKDSDKTITWISGDKTTEIKNLPDGVYTLTETAAPLGYDIASAVTFTIKDGVVTGSENSVIPADDDNPAIVRVFDALCTTDVDISKKSVSGDDELPGATFKLTGVAADGSTVVFEDKNIENTGAKLGKGNESIEFISGDVPTRIKSLPDATYTLEETGAPQGYKITSAVTFIIENGVVSSNAIKTVKPAEGDNPAVVTVFDDVYKTNVKISKKSLGSGDELPGAELHLTGKDLNGKTIIFNEDNVKDTNASIVYTKDLIFFNSGSEPTEIKNLPDGKYTLTEKAAPYGYDISSNIEFSIENGVVNGAKESVTPAEGTNPAVVTMFDSLFTKDVVISKTAVGGGEELPGATLTLTGKTNEVNNSKNIEFNSENVKDSTMLSEDKKTITWTTDKEANELKNLPDGIYTLTETAAPEGYEIASKIVFEIKEGKVVTDSVKFIVVDENGKESESAATEGTYTEENGKTVIRMFDAAKEVEAAKTDVEISKKVLAGGSEELEGAKLILSGKTFATETEESKYVEFSAEENGVQASEISEDKSVLTWTTGETAKVIKNLPDGHYTLVESAAPEGYEIASSIIFDIKDGRVVADSVKTEVSGSNPGEIGYGTAADGTYTEATDSNPAVITMFDDVKVYKTAVDISKQTVAGKELPGATLTLTGKSGNEDITFTSANIDEDKISKDGKTISFVSGQNPTTIYALPDGIYTLHEKAAPKGYVVATNITFTIEKGVVKGTEVTASVDGKNAVITMVDGAEPMTDVKISKQAVGGGKELEGATLTLTGKDADGKAIDFTDDNVEGTTATVSDDKTTITFVSGDAPTEIKSLPDGTYTLTEKAAPEGYEIASNIMFTIKDGKVVADSVKTEVVDAATGDSKTGDAPENTLTEATENSSAIITMFDDLKKVEEETTEEVTTEEVTTEEEKTTEEVTTEEEKTTEEVTTEETSTEEVTTETPVVEESKTDVKISKQAVGGGNELEGATLTLIGKDADGKDISFTDDNVAGTTATVSDDKLTITFVSGDAPTEIKSLADGTYTLTEKAAPEGYEIASNIMFTIKDGKVVADSVKTEVKGSNPGESGYGTPVDGTYTEATDSNPAVITMFDDVKVYKTAVDISKQTVLGDELEGATLTLTGKSGDEDIVFTSANINENKISEDGKTISYVSGKTPTTIYALPDGTYTLTEKAAPKGYVVATDIKFTIEKGVVKGAEVTASVDGKNAIITMVDGAEPKTDVKISKQAVGGGKELEGATLTLTGKDADGKAIDFTDDNVEGTTATVSDDKTTITFVSGDAPTEIKSLADGTYTLTEKAAPEGYEIASNIIFTIKDGKVVADSVKTEVVDAATGDSKTGDAPENTLTEATENSSAIITMFDDLKKVEEETTEEVTTEEVTTEEEKTTEEVTTEEVTTEEEKTTEEVTTEEVTTEEEKTTEEVTTEEVTTEEEKTTEEVTTEEVTTEEEKTTEDVTTEEVTTEEEKTTEEVTTEEPTTETPVVEESKTNVKISKQAVGGGKELEGATLTLTGKDADGKNISFTDENVAGTKATISDDKTTITFVSGDAPTEIKDLADGTYTLTEKAAPEGYEIASSITFTIKDGKVVADSVVTEVSDATVDNAGTQNAPEGTFTEATAQSSAIITMFDAVKSSSTPTKVDQGETQQEKPTEEAESKTVTTTEEKPNTTSSKTDVKEETPTEETTKKDDKNSTSSKTDVKEEATTEKATETTTEKATETTTEKATETTTQQKPEEKKPTTEVKEPSTTTTPSPNAPSTPEKDKNTVSTGDRVNVLPVIILLVISLIGIIFLVVRKIKMRYEY